MTNGNDLINVIIHPVSGECENGGLTKREYFAAMAMQGIVSNHTMLDSDNWEWLAKSSVIAADALIKELNNTPHAKP